MASYWVAQVEILDMVEYKKYTAAASVAISKYNGIVLSRSDEPSMLEGDFNPTRSVIIEFSSKEDALACYQSKEYQRAKALRKYVARVESWIM